MAGIVDHLFCQLDAVDVAAHAAWRNASWSGARPRTTDLGDFVQALHRHLRADSSDLVGAGVVFAPHALADADLAIEWWHRPTQDSRELVRMTVVLDPASEQFYDYPALPWFTDTRDSLRPTVVGPFVDLHGTGVTSLTFSRPFMIDGEFRGVTTADVALTNFERKMRKHLRPLGEAAVVNDEKRVIVSTAPTWTPGTLIRGIPDVEGRYFAAPVPSSAVSWIILGTNAQVLTSEVPPPGANSSDVS
ncbi:hypothetical protein HH308_06585 [Gordonia sp. TBRC 11910]|uniref:Cache domain-containing protein n=1 Tax=Gordonia asplenii TaxID=2725283 RepID=A0A848KRZ3_9ACTN|nr:cache domain-containing protein [Gordonia asplenii]NMO00879.1 hypothetical protein [Gordonia asplenii]